MKEYVARELAKESSSAEEFRQRLIDAGGSFNSRPEECCVMARVDDEDRPIKAYGGDTVEYLKRNDRYCFNPDLNVRSIHSR